MSHPNAKSKEPNLITQQNGALLAKKVINYMDLDSRLVIKKRTGFRLKIHHVEVRSPPSLVYVGVTELVQHKLCFPNIVS